jgi:hypothetical protein
MQPDPHNNECLILEIAAGLRAVVVVALTAIRPAAARHSDELPKEWRATPQAQVDSPLVAAGVRGNIGDRDDFSD